MQPTLLACFSPFAPGPRVPREVPLYHCYKQPESAAVCSVACFRTALLPLHMLVKRALDFATVCRERGRTCASPHFVLLVLFSNPCISPTIFVCFTLYYAMKLAAQQPTVRACRGGSRTAEFMHEPALPIERQLGKGLRIHSWPMCYPRAQQGASQSQ